MINNRPLDGEPLVRPAPGLLGETKLIGTDAFIAFLESLDTSVNSTIVLVSRTTVAADQLLVSAGRLNADIPRQVERAFSRVAVDQGLRARIDSQIDRLQSSIEQQLAALTSSIGEIRAEQQRINERIARVEAVCLSNRVR